MEEITTDTDFVWSQVQELVKDLKNDSVNLIKYKRFVEEFPKLYEILVKNPNLDLQILKGMLNRIVKIQNSELTKKEAELEQGEDLAEVYLYPKLGRPDPSQMTLQIKEHLKKHNKHY